MRLRFVSALFCSIAFAAAAQAKSRIPAAESDVAGATTPPAPPEIPSSPEARMQEAATPPVAAAATEPGATAGAGSESSAMLPVGELPKNDRERVERYLTNLRTLTADFTQIAPDGAVTSGQVFIKRPNKMRWVYDAPTPILMVTRGNFLTYYDYQLKQVSDIPLDSTMLGFFASDKVRFGETVKVVGTEKQPGLLRIRLRQADKPKLGMLTLEFSDAPLTLRNFVILDAQGKTTSIALNNARFDEPLPDEVFEFIDPRIKGRQRQRSGTDAQ